MNHFSGKHKLLWIWCVCSLIACSIIPAKGQMESSLQFHRLTGNDGLSQNFISCMMQDYQGFMWIGTKDGLNRYDGYTFTVYRHDAFNAASLSNNYITSLYEDKYHNLWAGTRNGGLNLLDRKRNRFVRVAYLAGTAAEYKQETTAITADPDGRHLLIGNNVGMIYEIVFPLQHADSLLRQRKGAPLRVKAASCGKASARINDFYTDENGMLWIATDAGLWQMNLCKRKPVLMQPQKKGISVNLQEAYTDRKKPITIKPVLGGVTPWNSTLRCILADGKGNIWLASDGIIFKFNNKQDSYDAFTSDFLMKHYTMIRSLAIRSVPGKREQIWAGLYHGLAILNLQDSVFERFSDQALLRKGVTPAAINSAWCDKSGMIWLGSNGNGIYTYSPEITLFDCPKYNIVNQPGETMARLSLRSFCEMQVQQDSSQGDILWIGTQDHLYKIDRKAQTARMVSLTVGKHVIGNAIYSLADDKKGHLWVGCQSGVIAYDPVSRRSRLIRPYDNVKDAHDPRVEKVFFDHAGKLWIATDYTLSCFQPGKQSFIHYWYRSVEEMDQYSDPTYPAIYEDAKHVLWLGTGNGLYCFDPDKHTFTAHYKHYNDKPNSISADVVTGIVPDHNHPEKYLWVGTAGGGLNRFDLTTKQFIHFTEKNGLANNNIYGILADTKGCLWVSTNDGISRFDPGKKIFTSFDVNNNLQSNEFNFGAFYKSPSGEMFFGGINGFNSFRPEQIGESRYLPPILITALSLPEQDEQADALIPANISVTDHVDLPFNKNNFTISLASLDFAAPGENEYAYRISNKNDEWISLGTNRKITFTNLAPGKYVFQAKGTNSTGYWNPDYAPLVITITPPWWKTVWAYVVYGLMASGLVILFRKKEINRLKLESNLKVERMEAQKLKELDHLKSRFFANISHEFRTPLTLLIGPLEDLMQHGDAKAFKEMIPEMHHNSKRLLQLINQLLDLSRLDAGKYRINTMREDIIPFVKQIVNSFSSMAHAKDVRLETDVDPRLRSSLVNESVSFFFDDDIIEKVLSNLLSNAFKFTPKGGNVIVTVGLSDDESEFMELKVQDNGTGIPSEQLPHIFDRFYQAGQAEHATPGTGIGLALLKELVELHQGSVSVSSEPGKGTTFRCRLPFNKKIITDKQAIPAEKEARVLLPGDPGEDDGLPAVLLKKGGSPVVLVVEDQQDVRKYLVSRLEDRYIILEARHGKQGFKIATEEIPDLVISDVMMPEMDGFELCRLLKADTRTSHIPVILLTARAEDTDKLDGLTMGADAYLIKPFNSAELRIRVDNLIALRNRMRSKFSTRLAVKPEQIAITPQDTRFMKKLLDTVEANMDNSAFSVTSLAEAANMSVSQLNRKLKALVNLSALQFIRSIRLQRATELLKKDTGTVAEIAYKTGFENPGYFSKVFKDQFGFLPSDREKFTENNGSPD